MESHLQFLEGIIEQGGPEPSQYSQIGEAFDAIHRSEIAVHGGAANWIRRSPALESFFCKHKLIFRSEYSMQGFAFTKPHGYAGDFEMIEKIYHHSISTLPNVRKWDEFFHLSDAARAVRNRSELLRGFLKSGIRLASIGSGPGLDVCGALSDDVLPCGITFVDNDQNALARAKANLSATIGGYYTAEFIHKNALRYRPKQKLDLIWCAGLFDYLPDKTAIYLLRRFREMVSSDGQIIVGNFSNQNSSRPYMEIVGEWFLIHRTRDDMTKIASESGFHPSQLKIVSDETGVNIFMILEQ